MILLTVEKILFLPIINKPLSTTGLSQHVPLSAELTTNAVRTGRIGSVQILPEALHG